MSPSLKAIFVALRPPQWVKNTPIFAGLIFSQGLFLSDVLAMVVAGFILFCMMASAVYLFNDVLDREKDKLHPEKCKRPIASGELPVPLALVFSACLGVAALGAAYLLDRSFFLIGSIYLAMNVGYSLLLKHLVIIDVMCLAFGFLLRILAGTTLSAVEPSSWLLICTISLSLFLGFSKRRHELATLGVSSNEHRTVMKQYSVPFLDQMIVIATAMSIMSYSLYTVSEETVVRFGTRNLVFTIPIVLYGIYRYLYLIHMKNTGGNPTSAILSDKPMLLNAMLWLGVVILVLYG